MDYTLMTYPGLVEILGYNEEPSFSYKDIRCDISFNKDFRFLTQSHGYDTINKLILDGEINGKRAAELWEPDEIRRKITAGDYLLADYGKYQYTASYGDFHKSNKFRIGYTQIFASLDSLLTDGLIAGKHIKEIWDEFEAN